MSFNQSHKALVRETLGTSEAHNPAKRRRRRRTVTGNQSPTETVEVDSVSTDDFEDVDLEDVDLEAIANNGRESVEPSPTYEVTEKGKAQIAKIDGTSLGLEVDSDDFDDLEDVDMELLDEANQNGDRGNETLTFSINSGDKERSEAKKKRTFVPILKQERIMRKLIHKLVLFSMICHGAIRNRWCGDMRLLDMLKKTVSAEIASLFHQDNADVLSVVKAKRFVDGLRKLLTVFSRKFKVTSPGIQRRDWGSTGNTTEEKDRNMSFERFMKCIKTFHGSRDVGAQAFVAVLRSMGVNARLVFSVQVPDYRSIRPVKDGSNQKGEKENPIRETNKPKSEFDPVFIPNPRQAMLSGIRSRKRKMPEKPQQKKEVENPNYPVFWIEVWNKYSRKWITVDPIVFKVVEVMPMRRKCKFDAPAAEESHQTWYVIAYDERNVIKDVTRRYTQFYNAKTVKKRIGFASDEDAHWYSRVLRSIGKQKGSISQAEAMELKEFHDRHVCEGTPNNMADFKNHPVYALEPQLRQDEIIYPNDETSKCGTFRSSNKSSIMPVYKRSCVHKLKTPKAWHMSGRVLKVGAQPLKTKKAHILFADEEGDDDGIVRLYAEFQTELYIPPPIIDGKITKNAYGNVEIFRPTMVPENGALLKITREVSMKMLENAARWVLNIDYAKAIVSFEFGKALKNKRAPTAKEGGILIDAQYKEAMLAVLDGLREQEEQEKREAVELNALRSWNFFMKKLQIVSRLDRSHGKVTHSGEDADIPLEKEEIHKEDEEEEDEEGYFSVGSDDEISDNEAYIPRPTRRSQPVTEDQFENEEYGGGFLAGDAIFGEKSEASEEGGFLLEDTKNEDLAINVSTEGMMDDSARNNEEFSTHESGGFLIEPEITETTGNFGQMHTTPGAAAGGPKSESNLAPDTVSRTGGSTTVPKGEKTPRVLRSNRPRTRTAEAQNKQQPSQGHELIDLDSDSLGDNPSVKTHFGRRTRSRLAYAVQPEEIHDLEDVKPTYDDASTHNEEQELGIEYSDSS